MHKDFHIELFDASPDCIFLKDNAFRYLYVNPSMSILFNIPREEFSKYNDFDIFIEQDAKKVREEDEQVLNGDVTRSEIVLYINGMNRTFQVVKSPVFDENGEVSGISGIARDITDYKHLTGYLNKHIKHISLINKLYSSLEEGVDTYSLIKLTCDQLRDIHNLSFDDCYFLEDNENTPYMSCVYTNIEESTLKAIEDLSGLQLCNIKIPLFDGSIYTRLYESREPLECPRREDVEKAIADLVHPDDVVRREKAVEVAKLAGNQYVFLVPIVFNGKTIGHIGFNSPEQFDPESQEEIKGIVYSISNIIGRKRYEDALKRQKEMVTTLLDNLPGMVFRCEINSKWTMHFISDGCLELTGYTREQVLHDRDIAYADIIHEDDRKDVFERVMKHLDEGNRYTIKYRIKTRSGEIKWAWERGQPSSLPGQNKKYIEGFISDITDQMTAEREVRLNEARLEALHQLNLMADAPLKEIKDFALESAVELTKSEYGFLAFVDEENQTFQMNSWSRKTIEDCNIIINTETQDVQHAGLWGDAIRQRRPVIINRLEYYGTSDKTFPTEHVAITSYMGVPVFDGERIVYLAGVANKESDYDDSDVRQLILLMQGLKNLIQQKEQKEMTLNSLKEKEVLLKEIHHRVKNNMQVISSLLNLQAGKVTNSTDYELFIDSKNRVHSMALVHEKLYRSDNLAAINMSGYLDGLTAEIMNSYMGQHGNVHINIKSDNVYMDIEHAIPTGLITNELVSNCIKHAFQNNDPGEVIVSLANDNHEYTLKVMDNGTGIPGTIDIFNTNSLGLQLVVMLTKQMRGSVHLERGNGSIFIIRFPSKLA